MSDRTVPCRRCGKLTYMVATALCLRCYELETRVQADPEIAREILDDMDRARQARVIEESERGSA